MGVGGQRHERNSVPIAQESEWGPGSLWTARYSATLTKRPWKSVNKYSPLQSAAICPTLNIPTINTADRQRRCIEVWPNKHRSDPCRQSFLDEVSILEFSLLQMLPMGRIKEVAGCMLPTVGTRCVARPRSQWVQRLTLWVRMCTFI